MTAAYPCSRCQSVRCWCFRDMRSWPLVAVLFARSDSIYKTMPGADVWDEARDARGWPGDSSLVAHPPCRGWGRLRQFPMPPRMSASLPGMPSHTFASSGGSWSSLPRPGQFPDSFGGWSMAVDQFIFGHRAEKSTWLYIVGCEPDDLPPMPIRSGRPTHCVRPTRAYPRLPSITKLEREATPPEFAAWLVEVARRCSTARRTAQPEALDSNKQGESS